jgi:hypothetical protein
MKLSRSLFLRSFNGAEIASDKIEITGALTYTVEVPGMFEAAIH